jgi:hypothetical protein
VADVVGVDDGGVDDADVLVVGSSEVAVVLVGDAAADDTEVAAADVEVAAATDDPDATAAELSSVCRPNIARSNHPA